MKAPIYTKDEEKLICLDIESKHRVYKDELSTIHKHLSEIALEMGFQKTKINSAKNGVYSWSGNIKVPYMNDIERKVLPNIVAKNPDRLVNVDYDSESVKRNIDIEYDGGKAFVNKTGLEKIEKDKEEVQIFLDDFFKKEDVGATLEKFAKMGLRYARAWAKVSNDGYYDGQKRIKKTCLSIRSPYNIFYDPRYINDKDIPAIIEVVEGVSFSQLKAKYPDTFGKITTGDQGGFTKAMSELNTIRASYGLSNLDEREQSLFNREWKAGKFTFKEFYGFYKLGKDKTDRLYRIITVSDRIILDMTPIKQIPYVKYDLDAGVDVNYPSSFLRDVLYLQKYNNWSMEKAINYVEGLLFDKKVIDSQGLDMIENTKALNPGRNDNIHIVGGTANEFVNTHMISLPNKTLDSNFYNMNNSIQRSIESLGLTLDINIDRSSGGVENTLGGAQLKSQQNNNVIAGYRSNFEKAVAKLGNLVLDVASELETQTYYMEAKGKTPMYVNYAFFANAVKNYKLDIEAGTMSAGNQEERLAKANSVLGLISTALSMGVSNIDTQKVIKETLKEMGVNNPDSYFTQQNFLSPTATNDQIPPTPQTAPTMTQ